MVDDSHAVGFMGENGRGTHEHSRRDGPRRHPHRHARQGARRRQRRLHQRAARRSSSCCASARARTCSPTTRCARHRRRLAQGARPHQRARRPARAPLRQHALLPRKDDRARLSRSSRASIPSSPVMFGDAELATKMAERLLERASTSSASPSRWCRRARPASACSSPPPIPAKTWNSP